MPPETVEVNVTDWVKSITTEDGLIETVGPGGFGTTETVAVLDCAVTPTLSVILT